MSAEDDRPLVWTIIAVVFAVACLIVWAQGCSSTLPECLESYRQAVPGPTGWIECRPRGAVGPS